MPGAGGRSSGNSCDVCLAGVSARVRKRERGNMWKRKDICRRPWKDRRTSL